MDNDVLLQNAKMHFAQRDHVTHFAKIQTRYRGEKVFGIKEADRLFHMYTIGRTGSGKTTLLETLLLQDIARGEGVALLDPHGDLVERVHQSIPEKRRADVVYFNVPDSEQPYFFNPLEHVMEERRPLAAAALIDVFKKMWDDAWGPKMEYILRHCLLALLDQPHATLADILTLLIDRKYREQVAGNIQNPVVKEFWTKEFPLYTPGLRASSIQPIQSKVGALLSYPKLYRILTKAQKPLDMRKIMDEKKILLVNLAKGRIGDDASNLLGGVVLSSIALAAFSRSDIPEHERKTYYLYVDEFQNFTTLAVSTMLSELRKYRLSLILANQFLHQLDTEVRYAVLGNVGTLICFRVGPQDASLLAREFAPIFEMADLLNLPNWHVYLKLMIDGSPSKPFSAVTIQPSSGVLHSVRLVA